MNRRGFIKAVSALGFLGTAVPVAKAATPDERIQSAINDIQAALQEKYPNFVFHSEIGLQRMRTICGEDRGAVLQSIRLTAYDPNNASID